MTLLRGWLGIPPVVVVVGIKVFWSSLTAEISQDTERCIL